MESYDICKYLYVPYAAWRWKTGFFHAGPTVWNSLPDELRNSDTFDGFKRFLKTKILFSRY